MGVLKKMLKRYVVVTIFIFHRGITEAELSCETETEDVQTIRPLIDLERYPLHRPGSPEYDHLLQFCREQLAAVGSVDLPGRVKFKQPQIGLLGILSKEFLPILYNEEYF